MNFGHRLDPRLSLRTFGSKTLRLWQRGFSRCAMGGFDPTVIYIVVAAVVDVILLLCCLYYVKFKPGKQFYGKPVVPPGQDPKEFALNELQER